MFAWNKDIFFWLNASSHPDRAVVLLAQTVAQWVIVAAAVGAVCLWIRGRPTNRGALLAVMCGMAAALGVNQIAGLLWFEPRPFMVGLGHTLMAHARDNSFPSDHATFMWSLGFGLIATGAARGWGWLVCLLGLGVAWARIFLGLHFPIDMAGSLLVAVVGAAIACAVRPMADRWVMPMAGGLYDATLNLLRLPPILFPRAAAPGDSARGEHADAGRT